MSEARKAIILVLIFIITVGSFYLYKISNINAQLDETKESIQKEEEYLELIANQLKEINNKPSQQEAAAYYSKLPSEKGIPQLLQFFHNTAQNNAANISSLSFEIEEQKSGKKIDKNEKQNEQMEFSYQSMNLNLRVSADSYEQLTSFMEDVYRANRMIKLIEFNMITAEENKVTVNFIYQAYYIPDMKGLIPSLEEIEEYEPSFKINPFKEENSDE